MELLKPYHSKSACWMIIIVGVMCYYNNSVEKTHWFSVAPDDSVLVHFAVHDIASYHNNCNNNEMVMLRYYTLLSDYGSSYYSYYYKGELRWSTCMGIRNYGT